MSLYLKTEHQGPVTIARILWEKVSQREAEILQPEILAALKAPIRLVVDLSAVTLLASAGLGMLITLHKTAQDSGGQLAVTGLSAPILEVLTITRLHKLLRIEATLEAAVKRVAS
jgi:anti-sigma B factor antagonist